MDLPRVLSKESKKAKVRDRHREKEAEGGREKGVSRRSRSPFQKGVEEWSRIPAGTRILEEKLLEEKLGVWKERQRCRSLTVPKKKR